MVKINQEAETKTNHKFVVFRRMLAEHLGVETAKRLVKETKPSEGYLVLWEAGLLDLSVEALMIKDEWRELFTQNEIEMATKKLRAYGLKV